MTKFLETLSNGLSVGSLYALIALGYTMVYGVLRFINFAHSNVFMIGAWLSFVFARWWGLAQPGVEAPWHAAPVILLASMVSCGILGVIIERVAYRPLRDAPRLNVLITAIGVSLLLENLCQMPWLFGATPKPMPELLPNPTLATLAGVKLGLLDALVIGTAVVLMLALHALVQGTKIGLAMRAVAHDADTAALMGVPVGRVISATFFIGSALAAAAGFLYALKYPTLQQPAHAAWVLLGLKAFVAAVVGGIGNIRGAMLGGLLIGLLEAFGAGYLRSDLRDVYVFAALIAVLLLRPSGILGKTVAEKV